MRAINVVRSSPSLGNPLTGRIRIARKLLRNLSSDLMSYRVSHGVQYDEVSWVFVTRARNRAVLAQ